MLCSIFGGVFNDEFYDWIFNHQQSSTFLYIGLISLTAIFVLLDKLGLKKWYKVREETGAFLIMVGFLLLMAFFYLAFVKKL